MNTLSLSWRLVRRDFKAGEVWLFLISLLVAITCISSINLFTDRIKRAMREEAATLLGGDLAIISAQPIKDNILRLAAQMGLQATETTSFLSMVRTQNNLTLADVKAVNAHYPLRGSLKISEQLFGKSQVINEIPAPGSLWVQPRLYSQLKLQIGDSLKIGRATLKVHKLLTFEPDRAGSWFAIAPRVLMNQKDLAKTDVIQPGSRVTYRTLLKGSERAQAQFVQMVKPMLNEGERIIDASNDRPTLAKILTRTSYYLNLSGVIAVIMAGIAIALASQKYLEKHQNTVALMRCFGASLNKIIAVFTSGLTLFCLLSIVLGITLGVALQWILESLFKSLVNINLPSVNLTASWPAVVIGLVLLLGFALPQLLRFRNVSANQLLRTRLEPMPRQNLIIYSFAIINVLGILLWQTGQVQLLLVVVAVMSLSFAVMYLLAQTLLSLLGKVTGHFNATWRMGLLNIVRHRNNSVLQITGFGMIFLVVLLLGLVRHDLLSSWQNDLPDNTPNYFAINISKEKVPDIQRFLKSSAIDAQPLYPIIRGRLVQRNGRPILQTLNQEQQQDRVLYRDINFTYRQEPPPANPIIAGQWWTSTQSKPLVSVEQGVAQRLGLNLNDQLGFTVAGTPISATITSIREVNWTSFRPSFFFVFTPGLLEKFSSTYMTSFYLPKQKIAILNTFSKQFPNVTLIDVADIISSIQTIINHVSGAITYILVFLVSIGVLVLIASILANIDERRHETAILRAQGATGRQVQILLLTEFTTLGALAGLAAAITAIFCNWVLSSWLFTLSSDLALWPLWVAPISSSLLIALSGYLGAMPVLRAHPIELLRTFDA